MQINFGGKGTKNFFVSFLCFFGRTSASLQKFIRHV